jgi:hypothetical protein
MSLSGRANSGFNLRCGFSRVLVLPDPYNDPTESLQAHTRVFVAFPISLDLRRPVVAVYPVASTTVLGAAMPEAAIDEHCNLLPRECDVRSPAW